MIKPMSTKSFGLSSNRKWNNLINNHKYQWQDFYGNLLNNSTVLNCYVSSHLMFTSLFGGDTYSHLIDKNVEVQAG